MSKLEEKLIRLKEAVEQDGPDPDQVAGALNDVLAWLNGHNTDENCRTVDIFVSTKIDPDMRQRLPTQLAEILADMGGALHDTHTAPEVAQNFYSTPEQLLKRLREYQDTHGYRIE